MKSTIVIIKSCWKNKAYRDAQRDTWIPYLGALGLPHKFIVGKRKDGSLANPDREQDLLIVPVNDARLQLAPKIAAACAWSLESGFTQMVVVDDDTFVDAARLGIYCGQVYFNGKDYVGFQGQTREWMSGSAYVLSLRAMRILSVASELTPNSHDDIQTGLALKGRVVWQHTDRFNVGPDPELMPLPTNEIITTHKCPPVKMREISLRHEMAFGR